jgi:hypothetical protein
MNVNEALPVVCGVLLVATMAAFALWPLLARRGVAATGALAKAPGDERFLLYRQVLDLEFDHQTGKLSKEDYELLSAQLLGRAASLLQEAHEETKELEDILEREIAAARRALSSSRRSRRLVTARKVAP